jgi:hypothetical protein
MSYTEPTITINYIKSTFEQYQPSTINGSLSFDYGKENALEELSYGERLQFLRKARSFIDSYIEHEIKEHYIKREVKDG